MHAVRMHALAAMAAYFAGCSPAVGPLSTKKDGGVDAASDAERADQSATPGHFVLRGGRLPGGDAADVEIDGGRIVAVGTISSDARSVDVTGHYVVPAFIDSHVHLAYLPMAPEMVAGGVVAAVDLAAPESFLAQDHAPIRLLASGPMITAPGGYPLDSWGSDGFGLGCADAASCTAAVDHLKDLGAALIKVPLMDPPELDDATVQAVVDRAHVLGLKVAVHALSESAAHRGAVAGADVLAHMPVEALTQETLATWQNRTVITTLAAFGGAAATENARAFHDARATVLYGTDFGNTTTAGVDGDEIREMVAAGFDGAAIVAAGTSVPAAFWGFDDLGTIAPGKAASLLVVEEDPFVSPATLASPLAVYVAGSLASPPTHHPIRDAPLRHSHRP